MADVELRIAGLEESDRWRAVLSPEEVSRAAGIGNSSARARYVVSRGLRRDMLAARLGRGTHDLRFGVSERGKPFLVNSEGWEFNASHAGDHVAVAVGRRPVGIDIEMLRAVRDAERIARRYFHADEARAWEALPENTKTEGFFLLWSAREAAMKCVGTGLAHGLHQTRVDPRILHERRAFGRVGEAVVEIERARAPEGYVLLLARN